MKKKIFALVLVVALVASVAVGLAACNNNGADGSDHTFREGTPSLSLPSWTL